jgi:pimeloyl-ACP methyl ester carboxylesterase
VFSHGWPLSAHAWDDQSFLVARNGFRAIANDRRGHGRSSQPWEGTRGFKGAYDCIKAFSEPDLTEDLKKFDVPTLIVHGDDDQIVPILAAAEKSSKLVPDSTLNAYPGAPHGLFAVAPFKDEFNSDLLEFIQA